MSDDLKSTLFFRALKQWEGAANNLREAREECRIAHGAATIGSTAKGVAAIKAEADAATTKQRTKRDELEVLERAAFHGMIFRRGIHGEGSTV